MVDPSSTGGPKKALLVGTARYDDARIPDLVGPSVDVEQLRLVLSDPSIGAFDSVDVVMDPSHSQLLARLHSFLVQNALRDDLLLVHLTCHGMKDDGGRLFFAARDTQVDALVATAVEDAWLKERLAESRSTRKLVTLDCCFSGVFTKKLAHKAPEHEPVGIRERFEGHGQIVLTASSATQYAYQEFEATGRPRPSLFTKAIVEGLATGHADLDRNGWIEVDELYRFVVDRMRSTDTNQTPTRALSEQGGDFALARSVRGRKLEVPDGVRRAAGSESSFERSGAILRIRRATAGLNAFQSEAYVEILDRLRNDDSKEVSEEAEALLRELEQRWEAPALDIATDALPAPEHVAGNEHEEHAAVRGIEESQSPVAPADQSLPRHDGRTRAGISADPSDLPAPASEHAAVGPLVRAGSYVIGGAAMVGASISTLLFPSDLSNTNLNFVYIPEEFAEIAWAIMTWICAGFLFASAFHIRRGTRITEALFLSLIVGIFGFAIFLWQAGFGSFTSESLAFTSVWLALGGSINVLFAVTVLQRRRRSNATSRRPD